MIDMWKQYMNSSFAIFWIKIHQRENIPTIGLYQLLWRIGINEQRNYLTLTKYDIWVTAVFGTESTDWCKFAPNLPLMVKSFTRYIAIDECSRFCYLKSIWRAQYIQFSTVFFKYLIKRFSFKIKCVWTNITASNLWKGTVTAISPWLHVKRVTVSIVMERWNAHYKKDNKYFYSFTNFILLMILESNLPFTVGTIMIFNIPS